MNCLFCFFPPLILALRVKFSFCDSLTTKKKKKKKRFWVIYTWTGETWQCSVLGQVENLPKEIFVKHLAFCTRSVYCTKRCFNYVSPSVFSLWLNVRHQFSTFRTMIGFKMYFRDDIFISFSLFPFVQQLHFVGHIFKKRVYIMCHDMNFFFPTMLPFADF